MKVGLVQMNMIWERKEENILKAEKMIQNAVQDKIDYLVFPEMSLTGFSMNIDLIGESTFDTKTIQIFSEFSRKYSLSLGVGYVERGIDKAYNRFAVINSLGEVIANYAKIHPFSYGEERNYYEGGDYIEYCKINDFITTPFICYDLRFPEIFQIASKKAQFITVAANWPIIRRQHWITLLKARAIENQCYIAGVNRVGEGNGMKYGGDSMIINPYGEMISLNLEGEGIVSAVIDLSVVTKYRDTFRLKEDRREELYQSLRRFPI